MFWLHRLYIEVAMQRFLQAHTSCRNTKLPSHRCEDAKLDIVVAVCNEDLSWLESFAPARLLLDETFNACLKSLQMSTWKRSIQCRLTLSECSPTESVLCSDSGSMQSVVYKATSFCPAMGS
ncbi:unnamed protein product [Durusdinium trenchii]|uniref:Uncharacterized protein n=1 Tax=Durusdinium trenchii TaxID=1381693 RepID=A0ABP0LM20_9DINO